jgi:bacillithiol system protein YtxJ
MEVTVIAWKKLKTQEELENLIENSHRVPSVIYKHSSRCGSSFIVKKRLEHDWVFGEGDVDIYFLDLVEHRDVSDEVSRVFRVRHESPQILVIRDGESVYDTSHGGVSVKSIKKALNGNGAG